MIPPTFTYKFRVECPDDIECLKKVMKKDATDWVVEEPEPEWMWMPDREVSFKSALDLNTIRNIFRKLPDSHIPRETIQLSENYTGARTYEP